jgi:uncharacterized protein Veg
MTITIKKISWKILRTGRWKDKRMREKLGSTYPVLFTIIEDNKGNRIEVPLSYNQIADMLEKHIYNERFIDELFKENNLQRNDYISKIYDGTIFSMENAIKKLLEKVIVWIREVIEDDKKK